MPMSEYVASMRSLVGHRMLLLPAVTAIAVDGDGRVLLGLHAETGRWSTIGGAIDPDESPLDAVAREVAEELGVGIVSAEILGAYGGPRHRARYPNGDESAFVTIVYLVSLDSHEFTYPDAEIIATQWVKFDEMGSLDLYDWIGDMLPDLRTRLGA